jgi:hypothetical protein
MHGCHAQQRMHGAQAGELATWEHLAFVLWYVQLPECAGH